MEYVIQVVVMIQIVEVEETDEVQLHEQAHHDLVHEAEMDDEETVAVDEIQVAVVLRRSLVLEI